MIRYWIDINYLRNAFAVSKYDLLGIRNLFDASIHVLLIVYLIEYDVYKWCGIFQYYLISNKADCLVC